MTRFMYVQYDSARLYSLLRQARMIECGFILEGIKFEIIYDMNVLESQKFQNDSHDLPNSTNIK